MDSSTAKKIKSKNTKIEIILGKALWSLGLRYRKNCKKVFGTPDFCFSNKKIAIFCDGKFWHGKKFLEGERFKTNQDFWESKIKRNIQRDEEVNKTLRQNGWTVIRFWDTQINKELNKCVETIKEAYEQNI